LTNFFIHIFLTKVIYSVITITKRMTCRNKREKQSKQVYMSSGTTNMVSEEESEHVIIIDITRFYYSRNKILL
jgi:uncharacterized protein YhfF